MIVDAVFPENPVLAHIIRGDLIESQHRGRIAVVDASGDVLLSAGDIEEPMYARSAVKPLQAVGMLRDGLDLDGELLALAAASHDGEGIHRRGVAEILRGAGSDVEALQNTPDLPLGERARAEWLAAGHRAQRITQNCSGKHAAMIRTCLCREWPVQNYLEPDHPLQRALRDTIQEFTGMAAHRTIDGCGTPLFATSTRGLALAFGHLASQGGAAGKVADAIRAHPEQVSGTDHPERRLHQAVPGLVCKGGVEGCLAMGLKDGTGIVVKIDDGNPRALMPIAVHLLRWLGVPGDAAAFERLALVPVLGHGHPVGRIEIASAPTGDVDMHDLG